jgi:cytochrome c biogenesis protein CcdA
MPLDPLELTFAFTAGVFTLFSPCAFPLFPGYISLYLGIDVPVKKAIGCGTACALGILAVLCAIGLVASVTGSLVFTYISFLQPVVGLFMILMGISMIIEISLPSFQPSISIQKNRRFSGIFLYGVAYGLATIGCSAPIFFSILFYAILSGEPFHIMLTFLSYAFGMTLPLVLTTIIVARSRDLLVKKAVRATPILHRISGVALILLGIYLTGSSISAFYAARSITGFHVSMR